MKLIGSIVAISGLKAFMPSHAYANEQLAWKVGLHMAFVFPSVLFALMSRLGEGKRHR